MLPLLIAAAQVPSFVVPTGWGVNIHFTDQAPGEIAKIAKPYRWVRMDLNWGGTERKRGEYDFSAYDRLLGALDKNGVRAYLILDYGNDLYQEGSPRSPEARAAFARWAAAAVVHFKGRGVVWEMWNEPNIAFWKPTPNVDEYIALAKGVGAAIRRVGPQELFVGPATSGFDWNFLQRCLDAGLLQYWNAVSVHPYRQNEPESVEADWLRLRTMIDRAATGRNLPMISGEWGYSELFQNQTSDRQGDYALRQYLVNLRCGVPISIWYDWKDDGVDPKESEHHFGTVKPDLSSKPAYLSAMRLAQELSGFTYVTRVQTADERQWLLLFRRGREAKIAYWTTGEPSQAVLPSFTITLQASPKLLSGPSLSSLLDWRREPWTVVDPLGLDSKPREFKYRKAFGRVSLAQTTRVVSARPLTLDLRPERDGKVWAILDDPNERHLSWGTLNVGNRSFRLDRKTTYPVRVAIDKGEDKVVVLGDGRGFEVSIPQFRPFSLGTPTATADGDAKIRASVSATTTEAGVRLNYDFDPGWRFAELHPAEGKVDGRPNALGIWILGNDSRDLLLMRYTDRSEQTFQSYGGSIDWQGWRYVRFPLDGSGSHWGGTNDGVVHWPIRIGTAILVDMPGRRGGKGAITVSSPVLEYPR